MSVVERRLVEYALIVTVPPATIWALLHAGEIGRWAVAVARRGHLLRARPVLTYDVPVERIVANLCRLSQEMEHVPPGTPTVKRNAVRMAYDDGLIAACRALEVPQSLDELGDGLDHELERLRVEAALENAGLRFRSANR